MPRKKQDTRKIAIVAAEADQGMRSVGGALTRRLNIDVDQLAVNVNIFLGQMGEVVAKTPDTVGNFRLAEIEVSAEITGKGQVVLWGVGGEASAGGGVKFVFKK